MSVQEFIYLNEEKIPQRQPFLPNLCGISALGRPVVSLMNGCAELMRSRLPRTTRYRAPKRTDEGLYREQVSRVPLNPNTPHSTRRKVCRINSPALYLSSSNSAPNRILSLIVSLSTQGSCAAYATPRSLGNENHESTLGAAKCISPSSARRSDVLPEPVGPTMRFRTSGLKRMSPSMRKTKFRRELVRPGVLSVLGVPGMEDEAGRDQVKVVL